MNVTPCKILYHSHKLFFKNVISKLIKVIPMNRPPSFDMDWVTFSPGIKEAKQTNMILLEGCFQSEHWK